MPVLQDKIDMASQQDIPLSSRSGMLNTARPYLLLDASDSSHAVDTTVGKQWAGERTSKHRPKAGSEPLDLNAEMTQPN